ncbi:MAG: A/G-specific adenine glycosylase [Thermoguttaceae bacterium]
MAPPSKSPTPLSSPLPDPSWRDRFRRRLRLWYRVHARDLPWRRNRDPYLVWISEIMLQQTQVETVRPYFERFRQAFPTIEALAAADEEHVLRLWEGLGYYRRARQLHRAAQVMVQQHDGRFPDDPEVVLRLPGIGRYTAGAVLSIAFDARQPILEANTIRLFCRLLAYRGRADSSQAQRLLWEMARAVLPRQATGDFNQALMELGSQVCTPKTPRCGDCPVAGLCQANALGLQQTVPAPKLKKRFQDLHEVALIVRRRGRVLLLRRPEGGRWAGLWDFPRYQMDHQDGPDLLAALRNRLCAETGIDAIPETHQKRLRHGVTRFRITLDCYCARFVGTAEPTANVPVYQWVAPDRLGDFPLSATGRKLARLIG